MEILIISFMDGIFKHNCLFTIPLQNIEYNVMLSVEDIKFIFG